MFAIECHLVGNNSIKFNTFTSSKLIAKSTMYVYSAKQCHFITTIALKTNFQYCQLTYSLVIRFICENTKLHSKHLLIFFLFKTKFLPLKNVRKRKITYFSLSWVSYHKINYWFDWRNMKKIYLHLCFVDTAINT